MSKYAILGGFLGAGKTTTMMALSDEAKREGLKAAILVNDLGTNELVDGSFTASRGYLTESITGGCICYQTENLVNHLRVFRDEDQADLILSDIPGCGIGALEHVYHHLAEQYPGEFSLAPFTAVADPERLRRIMPEHADLHLPEEMDFLFRAQLQEAEVILLNKIDLITKEEAEKMLSWLRSSYPEAAVFAISAQNHQGIDAVLAYLMKLDSELHHPDIGYGGPEFMAAEGKLTWYDCQFHLEADTELRVRDYLTTAMENIRQGLLAANRNVPHLKAMGEDEDGHIVKASLIGVDYPLQLDAAGDVSCRSAHIIVNARAACEPDLLKKICDDALARAADSMKLSMKVEFTECFGMMD